MNEASYGHRTSVWLYFRSNRTVWLFELLDHDGQDWMDSLCWTPSTVLFQVLELPPIETSLLVCVWQIGDCLISSDGNPLLWMKSLCFRDEPETWLGFQRWTWKPNRFQRGTWKACQACVSEMNLKLAGLCQKPMYLLITMNLHGDVHVYIFIPKLEVEVITTADPLSFLERKVLDQVR